MTYQDKVELAKEELLRLGSFNNEELEDIQNDTYYIVFSSWEYSQIFYVTDEELYYIDRDEERSLCEADTIQDTENGRAYCFN